MSAALDVCVASSIAAAARGDAAQAAFDRNLTHYSNEIGELNSRTTATKLILLFQKNPDLLIF